MSRFWFSLTALTVLVLGLFILLPNDSLKPSLACQSSLPEVNLDASSLFSGVEVRGFKFEIGYDASKVCPIVIETIDPRTGRGCQIYRREKGAEGTLFISCAR